MRIVEKNNVIALIDTIIEAIQYCISRREDSFEHIEECIYALKYIYSFISKTEPAYDLNKFESSINNLMKLKTDNEKFDILKKEKKNIQILKDDVIKNIKGEFTVVFLPYKASMWSAFESIWKEANRDPNCKCIVMPIPYFELDSNGVRKQMCYEGNEYPKDVEITHYDEYNIETENPDIIFIHNPYDDTNTLTQVEPKYYSRNLRNYTNMLVYSPYYTLRYYNPKKGINLCFSPATIYSNKIITQSERLKEIYIEHGHRPEKLLPLGSPKIDSVIHNIKNPPEISEEWKRVIEDKTVFLINIHLSFFTRYKEEAFEKVNIILEQIEKNEKCIGIWRPHPLMELMLKSNAPEYLEKYRSIVKRIEESDRYIIDTYSDYSYAFLVADAMFSTYSSLVTEFMVTGKPVFILEKKNSDELNKISPVDYSYNYYFENDNYYGGEFIQMVKSKNDYLYEKRMEMIRKAFVNSLDGNSGKKIYEHLKMEIINGGI